MKPRRMAALFVAGFLGPVLGTGVASGETELFGVRLDGSVDLGPRYLLEKPSDSASAKFEEYRGDVRSGILFEDFHLRLSTKDDRYQLEVSGKNVGEDDQNFKLRSSRTGRYEFEFEWDDLPHIYSTTGRLLGTNNDGVFTLPTPRPPLTAHNTAPELDEIGILWRTQRFSFTLTPTPNWDLKADFTRIHKEGDRPMGMAFGSPGGNHREILEPIDQTIYNVKLSASLAEEKYQLQLTYDLSLFQNDFDAAVSDNPCFRRAECGSSANGPAQGRSALAPDNVAQTVTLSGGVNLPLRTRVNGSLSYSWRLQDHSFLPHTINPAFAGNPNLALPQSDLEGDVRILLLNLSATSRPLPPLTLTAKYRIFDFDDRSDEIVFPARVLNDITLENEPRLANRFPYTKQNASLDGRWRFSSQLASSVGIWWERWDRSEEHREVPTSDEYTPKVAVDYTPTDWLLVRATYAPSFRRIDEYNTFAHLAHVSEEDEAAFAASQHLLLRKYDEADRNRQRLDLLFQLTPIDTVTVDLTGSYRNDDYTDSVFGLTDDKNWTAGFDVSWTPVERITIFGGYMREEYKSKQASRYRTPTQLENPTYDWEAKNTDTIDTLSLGVNAAVIPKTLDFRLAWSYSQATGKMRASNSVKPTGGTASENTSATAVDFPDIKDSFHQLEASLRYFLRKDWTVKLAYLFERFTQTDFRTDGLVPFPNPAQPDIFLGNDLKDYTAQIVSVILGYRF